MANFKKKTIMKFCNSLLVVATMALTNNQVSAFIPYCSSVTRISTRSTNGLLKALPHSADVDSPLADEFLRAAPDVRKVQGDTLKTWDFGNPNTARVQVGAKGSNGRPIHSRIEYWHTPSYVPFQVTAYTEDGLERPIDCIIETPKHPKTIAIFNTASQQMPFDAAVDDTGLVAPYDVIASGPNAVQSDIVQGGGMIKYYTFDADVESIAVYIRSPEYNMKSKLELTTGPNSVRQTYEVYTSSGYKTPFYAVIQTPGEVPSTLRIINQNSVEFPFDAYVMPYKMRDYGNNSGVGGDDSRDRYPKPSSNIMGTW
mmetsp:Transcript_12022/g.13157  ORF Transcript_12022/g.13157 Transcript_12022/m.13157 type:complete len:313 (+) Transcript_12022:23-961(+)